MIKTKRKFYLIHIFLMLCLPGLRSQNADYYIGNVKYSFINYDKNQLLFPDTSYSLNYFLSSVDTLIIKGKGKLSIVHIGGSHLQGDYYTQIIRTRFQEIAEGLNGGRGMIFPCKMALTNNPENFSVNYSGNWTYSKCTDNQKQIPLGLTGMAVLTSDTLTTLNINPNCDSSRVYSFNQVRVFHEPGSFSIYADTKGDLVKGVYNDTLGFTLLIFKEEQYLLNLIIEKDFAEGDFILQGISLDSDAPGIVYNAIGVNGASLSSYLNCERFVLHLKDLRPSLVLYSIGTNDGNTRHFDSLKFIMEYRCLLDSTFKAAPNSAVILTVPNDSYLFKKYMNTNTLIMRNIIFELAKEYNTAIWDFYTIMGGLNSCNTWYANGLMRNDHIHFTKKGYSVKGDLLFSAFLKSWENQISQNNEPLKLATNSINQ